MAVDQTVVMHTNGVADNLFVIPLESRDRYILYAPLRHTAVIVNSAAINLLAGSENHIDQFDNSDSDEFIEFMKSLELYDAVDKELPDVQYSGDPKPSHVTLFLTTACNLRCSYCYASAGETAVENMSIDTARSGIDQVIKNALETQQAEITIAYHGGGEPGVNWRVLKQSYEYAQQLCHQNRLSMRAGMASNGVFRQHQIDWIIQHISGCSISFDGQPATQDLLRPLVNGKGSSKRVEETFRYFDQHDYAYAIRMTVTADHIASLPDSIEYIVTRFNPQQIQVEPAYQMGRWRDAPSAETDQFIACYREASLIAQNHGHRLNFSAARAGIATQHFCGISRDNFSLTPGGSVSACFETFSEQSELADHFIYGEKERDGGFSFDLGKLQQLRNHTGNNSKFCEACFARWSCAGDCHHKNRLLYGDKPFAGTDRCHIIRELTRDQILENIRSAGGLFWKQGSH
ncbi:MAG: hypothetical protein GY806_06315 [Gammaproteobacteria bacterium]|nr:hypothetical protein [Gammaproteobacteria bacterium]